MFQVLVAFLSYTSGLHTIYILGILSWTRCEEVKISIVSETRYIHRNDMIERLGIRPLRVGLLLGLALVTATSAAGTSVSGQSTMVSSTSSTFVSPTPFRPKVFADLGVSPAKLVQPLRKPSPFKSAMETTSSNQMSFKPMLAT